MKRKVASIPSFTSKPIQNCELCGFPKFKGHESECRSSQDYLLNRLDNEMYSVSAYLSSRIYVVKKKLSLEETKYIHNKLQEWIKTIRKIKGE